MTMTQLDKLQDAHADAVAARAEAQQRKDEAARAGNKSSWVVADKELEWLTTREKLAAEAFQAEYARVKAAEEAADAVALADAEVDADADHVRAQIHDLAEEASVHAVEIELLRRKALQLAANQREQAARVRILARKLVVLRVVVDVGDGEADVVFGLAVARHARTQGVNIKPLSGITKED